MDYIELKLRQKLVMDAGSGKPRQEEDLFYQSFGSEPFRIIRRIRKLVFWTKSKQSGRAAHASVLNKRTI